ncbi:MAG: hypothetical protein NTX33_18070 [Propionibacteriales bacterium]|nr:hypothetical protein [Propionibacteriales bacterium]
MMTVHEVAERYGVSDAFMVRALDLIGFRDAEPGTALPEATVDRFEAVFGNKIRAARPAPDPEFRAESDAAPTAARAVRKPKPHVMRVAHAAVTGSRDAQGNRVKALLANPGPVHAMDPVGTWDGDPWSGEVVPGAVHFFGGPLNSGPRAACGWMHIRAVLGDAFVPAGDPRAAGQCPRCAELVAEGKGFRSPPGSYDPFCHAFLYVKFNSQVEVQNCSLSGEHRGLHRTRDGATWDIGFDDFTPAPLDAGCRVTKVS